MLKTLAAGSLFAACVAFPAHSSAQVGFGITIGQPPPPMRYERRPPMPGEGFVWEDGYWGVNSGRYVWMPGRWERPPYPGAYWTHPHYDRYADGWHMHEGHWDREDHGDHHDWDRDHGRNDRGRDRDRR
jgi:hypothetical protein